MKKRLLALVMVLVLMLATVSSALAAKPTATINKASKNQTVKVGKEINFKFSLNSGSYSKKGGFYRAKLGILIMKDGDKMGSASWVWTGKQVYSCKAKLKKTAPLGKYNLQYTTYYRKNGSADWKKVKTQSTKFTVKK